MYYDQYLISITYSFTIGFGLEVDSVSYHYHLSTMSEGTEEVSCIFIQSGS